MFTLTITPQQRKLVQIATYYLLPIGLLGAVLLIGDGHFFKELGEKALLLVALNLYIKPVAVLFKHQLTALALTFRREIGIASFWLYAFHSAGMFISRGLEVSYFLNPQGFLFWGGIAGFGMYILGLTSNNFAQKLLKKNWKKVQSSAYLVFIFASYHSALASGSFTKMIVGVGLFVVLKVLQYLVPRFLAAKK